MITRGRQLAAWGAAALAGVLHALAMAAPWNGQPQWWLQLLSLGALAALVQRQASWQRAAFTGWLFATAWLTATFWWLFISMHVYGGLAAPLAVVAVVGLAGFLSLYYAAACGVLRALASGGAWRDGVLFGALWLLGELLRGTWFTGFPWGAAGYAHVDGPLAFLAPWIGVYAMGAVAAGIAFVVAQFLRREVRASPRYWGGIAVAAALLAACNLDALRLEPVPATAPPLRVALLQGNIAQDEKFQGGSGIPDALAFYGNALANSDASLVVAPETAIPLLPQQLPDDYLTNLRRALGVNRRAALFGMPMGGTGIGYTNSVIGIRWRTSDYRYDKHHLVPFGEFVPPLFKWFTRMMNIPLGDFGRGAVGQPSFEWLGQRLAPNICYEDLFGEELGARFVDPAKAPTIFVNASNIGWFGNTIAIDQHLQISRMRALEFHRPMLRATNTGATVVIDSHGKVTHAMPRHTRGVLLAEVQGGSGITPFAWWVGRLGLWPLWGLGLAVVALAVRARRRQGATYNHGFREPPARA